MENSCCSGCGETKKNIFTSYDEYINTLNKVYENIKNDLNKYIVEDTFEYKHMSYQGLTGRQWVWIPDSIQTHLKLITSDNKYCYEISGNIITGIKIFIDAMKKSNVWDRFYSTLTAQELSNMIYHNIVYQFENLLENKILFKCHNCEQVSTEILNDENSLCDNCCEK